MSKKAAGRKRQALGLPPIRKIKVAPSKGPTAEQRLVAAIFGDRL